VRGVGLSGGSIGLFGLSTTTNERDFASVEEYFAAIFQPEEIRRVVSGPGEHCADGRGILGVLSSP